MEAIPEWQFVVLCSQLGDKKVSTPVLNSLGDPSHLLVLVQLRRKSPGNLSNKSIEAITCLESWRPNLGCFTDYQALSAHENIHQHPFTESSVCYPLKY